MEGWLCVGERKEGSMKWEAKGWWWCDCKL